MHLLAIVFYVAVASAETLRFQQPSSISDNDWELFKMTYKKTYPSDVHEGVRRTVWHKNLQVIHKHNLEADMNIHSYRLGVNEYADMSAEEFNDVLNGFRGNISNTTTESTFLPLENFQVPTTVDWRSKGYVTPVKNQGFCGSCWAFSSTGALEGQHFRKTGNLVSLSEQNLVDCSGGFGNNGCNGGLMTDAFRYIKANQGIDTERSYPYRNEQGACHFKRADVGATVTGYAGISRGNEAHLQMATAYVGPITAGIDAHHHSIHLYKSGVYDERRCSSVRLSHAVLIVGYGTYNGKDYWLVKNSWGPSWGLGGYIMMSRNKNNQCGIATFASYPLV